MKTQRFFKFICPAVLILTAQLLGQAASPPSKPASKPPPAPSTGTPKGNSTPGTTRPEMTCKQTAQPLTALNANNGSDFTISANPSFWFYVPYTQEDIKHAEFLLLDGRESTTIYQTEIKLAAKPGLIQLSLPANSLQPNQTYRWYLMVNCRASRSNEPDAVVDGWIHRKMLDDYPQKHKSQKLDFYTKHHLWYDAIALLAQQRFQYPDNPEIQAAWNNLLKVLGKESVAQEEFVGSAVP
ncbi:DUF928 domain-containing protein [Calothrix sp. UHCC 0171]|uniref:DUF928 domain-containing protein n=1 Tax=Calothrix sp. UHCC 0171 TaxID=3110245 RepID=UPI002B205D2D|nr:DUF928 domain-containing protein [Calothrix sp. UHCC 0171]MEA5573008.1 DUF928 domain-containing protein [Calothrix sp. UHCC 0171]